jgi:hypothetical protein
MNVLEPVKTAFNSLHLNYRHQSTVDAMTLIKVGRYCMPAAYSQTLGKLSTLASTGSEKGRPESCALAELVMKNA